MKHILSSAILLSLFSTSAMAEVCSAEQLAKKEVVISPVNLFLDPSQKVATVRITNCKAGALPLQMRGLKWTQANGESVEVATQEIRFQPTMATIPSGQTQVVRVVKATAPVTGREETFRISLKELPNPEDKSPVNETTAKWLLEYMLPLIYRPAGSTPKLTVTHSGSEVTVTNNGTATAKFIDMKSGGVLIRQGLVGYVLPGSTMRFKVQGKINGPLSANVNGNEQSF